MRYVRFAHSRLNLLVYLRLPLSIKLQNGVGTGTRVVGESHGLPLVVRSAVVDDVGKVLCGLRTVVSFGKRVDVFLDRCSMAVTQVVPMPLAQGVCCPFDAIFLEGSGFEPRQVTIEQVPPVVACSCDVGHPFELGPVAVKRTELLEFGEDLRFPTRLEHAVG